MITRMMVALAVGTMAVGCGGGEPGPGSATGALTIEATDDGVRGSFVDDSERDLGRVDFTSRYVDRGVLEIVLEFHGMMITQLLDLESGVMELDGFAADNAEDTQMMVDDHALLLALSHAIDGLGADIDEPAAQVRDFASWYSEFPSGMDMQWLSLLPETRGASSLCWAINTYQGGTHDGWLESNWSDKTTIDGVWISRDGSCNAYTSDDNQGTWWYSGSWSCLGSEPNHSTSMENAYGDCFARCGSGCGGGNDFTYSCLDHDVCNRFGHSWAASLPGGHCADEFASAGAEMVSEPDCS